MSSRRVRCLALVGLCGWLMQASAESEVEVETATGDNGQACRKYEYQRRDLAEQRESRLVFDAFEEHQGKTIRKIRYESRDIFDESIPEENNWLYRGLNKLHINTRETVVAGQLLFLEGEPLNNRLIKESERILRSRNYLTSAYIVPEVICPDYIDILVVTRDSWVAEPELSFSHEGGETRSGFGIKDGNFLGTGDAISIGYSRDIERTSVSYEYRTPHLFQTRLAARVYYAQKSDGEDRALKLEQPFYSLNTPWAAGVETQHLSEINVIREGGEHINEYRHRIRFQEIYGGFAAISNDEITLRLLTGLTRQEDRFFENEYTFQALPEDRKTNYGWLGLSYIDTEFATYKNLNQIQRTEDLALGTNIQLRLGYGNESMGNDYELTRYYARYNRVVGVGNHHVMQFSAHATGYQFGNNLQEDTGTLGLDFSYNLFRDDQNRWYTRIRYDQGWNLLQHEELTVGAISGLRGYPLDFQRGKHRYLFNLERRYFSDLHIFNIVRVGAVAYLDAGRAWGLEGEGVSNQHLSNLGVGLRMSSSKTRVGNVLHLDIASPMAEKNSVDDYQFLVKAEGRF